MSNLSNYPPGVTGLEPEIVGYPDDLSHAALTSAEALLVHLIRSGVLRAYQAREAAEVLAEVRKALGQPVTSEERR